MMFSNVSANSLNTNETNSWDNIFALAVDQHYDESQEKVTSDEANYFSMDLSFDEDTKDLKEKDLSDTSSTDNESQGSRSASCISINGFYNLTEFSESNDARPKLTGLLKSNYLDTITGIKSKSVEVMNAQKVINAQKMMMVNMFQKQAMMQMMVKANTMKVNAQEQTTTVVA